MGCPCCLSDPYPTAFSFALICRTGGENNMKNLTAWDKGALLCQVKVVCRSKAKRGICSLSPIDGQMSRHVLGSRFWVCTWVALDDKCHCLRCSHSSSFRSTFIAESDIVWFGISLRWVWVSCPSCVTPTHPSWCPSGVAGKALTLRAQLSNSQNTGVLWALVWPQRQRHNTV